MRRALVPLLLVLLAGCGEEERRGEPRVPAPGPSDLLVRYDRGGGVAGLQERLFVRPDGAAAVEVRDRRRTFELSGAELDRLREALTAARVPSLQRRYAPQAPVADGIGERILVDGRRVSAETGGDPPARLRRLLSLLGGILDSHRPQR